MEIIIYYLLNIQLFNIHLLNKLLTKIKKQKI